MGSSSRAAVSFFNALNTRNSSIAPLMGLLGGDFGATPVRTHEKLKAVHAARVRIPTWATKKPERSEEEEKLDAIHAAMMEELGIRAKAEPVEPSTSQKDHTISANPTLNANVGDILTHLNLMAIRRAAKAMNTERKVLNSFASQNDHAALTPLVARDTGVVIQGFPVRMVDIDGLNEARCDSILIALEGGEYVPPPHLDLRNRRKLVQRAIGATPDFRPGLN